MDYQYHIGVVAIPETWTPSVTLTMPFVSVREGVTNWTATDWGKVLYLNMSGILL